MFAIYYDSHGHARYAAVYRVSSRRRSDEQSTGSEQS